MRNHEIHERGAAPPARAAGDHGTGSRLPADARGTRGRRRFESASFRVFPRAFPERRRRSAALGGGPAFRVFRAFRGSKPPALTRFDAKGLPNSVWMGVLGFKGR